MLKAILSSLQSDRLQVIQPHSPLCGDFWSCVDSIVGVLSGESIFGETTEIVSLCSDDRLSAISPGSEETFQLPSPICKIVTKFETVYLCDLENNQRGFSSKRAFLVVNPLRSDLQSAFREFEEFPKDQRSDPLTHVAWGTVEGCQNIEGFLNECGLFTRPRFGLRSYFVVASNLLCSPYFKANPEVSVEVGFRLSRWNDGVLDALVRVASN